VHDCFRDVHRADPRRRPAGTGDFPPSIVQRLVNKHGGPIWAEGRIDAGAVFRF
jgi:signal transduction histidine kinase